MNPHRCRGRWRLKLAPLAVAACFAQGAALANPTGPTVVNGTAAIFQNGNLLQITNSPSAIINWQSFSIGANEITRFIQQSQASAVLNRVTGSAGVINPSVILGALQSKLADGVTTGGRVYLINPSGILFGAGAQIDVGGLVATSLNLSNLDFLANRLKFTEVTGAGSIVNQGNIATVPGGNVYLVGPAVTNSGIITSPQGEVVLAAGNRVELVNPGTPSLKVEIVAPDNQAVNLGQIVADSGRVGIYAGLINNSGTIRADSAVSEGGRILLKATKNATLEAGSVTTANGAVGGSISVQSGDTTLVAGTVAARGSEGKGGSVEILGNLVGVTGNAGVSASGETGGGTVLVGGDYQGRNADVRNAFRTYVGADTTIAADAVTSGDGGKVIVWSDDATRAYGTITARGGSQSGNGGFVETSGNYLEVSGAVNTLAPRGAAGNWLLDPQFLTVAISGGTAYAAGTNNLFASNPGGTTVITPASINASSSNVILQASTDVTFTDAVNISTPNVSLTAQAGRSILVNENITTSNGNVSLLANDEGAAGTRAAGAGGITMADGKTINAGTGMVLLRVGAGAGAGQESGNIVAADITAQNVEFQQNGRTPGSSNILRASSSSLITARNVLLEVDHGGAPASGSVGASGSPIRVAPYGGSVINLESHAHEASPGIFIEAPNAGTSLVIGDVPFFTGGVNGVQTVAGGPIEIKATGAGSSITLNGGTGACGFGAFGLTGGPICAGGVGGSSIALAANGISIGNVVDAGSGTLTLTSTGTVDQTAPIIAGVLELLGDGGAHTLTHSGNQVGEVRMNTGSVVLTNNGTTLVNGVQVPGAGQEAVLTAAAPVTGELLGASIAVDGDVMVVGAPGGFLSGQGAAYVYRWNGTAWAFEARLTAPGTINFGQSVAVQGDHIVVGAPETTDGVFRSGAAYAFEWNGSTWGTGAKLNFAGKGFESVFGQAVSIDNNRLVVGGAGNPDGGFWNGKIWFYDFSSGAWVEKGSARQSDPQSNDYFGTYLDISGNRMIVGAWNTYSATSGTGKAYVFEFNPATRVWTQTQKLTQTGGSANDNFGQTVSISGDIAVIGAPNSDPSGKTNAGALYVFKYNGASWVQEQVLTPSDLAASDLFGLGARVRDGVIIAAASRQDLPGKVDAGATYLFRNNGTLWVQDGKITASNALASDVFGSAVALNGQRTFIGAYAADPGGAINSGAAYAYDPVFTASTLAGGLTITSAGPLTQGFSLSAGGPVSYASGGAIALNGAITSGAAGDAIVIAGTSFANNAGASALSASNGRWLVWSADPASDSRGGLVYDFKQYGATYGVTPVQGTGNGFLYDVAPAITPSLTGATTKVYDATATAILTAANYATAGAIDGDAVVLNNPANGTYADKNIGAGKSVSAPGLAISSATNGSAQVFGYALASTTAAGNIGEITPATLLVNGVTANSKVYDATTAAALDSGAASVTPLLTDSVTLSSAGATGSFADKNVGSSKPVMVSGFTVSGADAGNYILVQPAGLTADITPKTVTIGGAAANDKVYDGTTAATLSANGMLGGLVGGETLTLSGPSAANFDTKDTGTDKTVTATGYSIGNGTGLASNYQLAATSTATADITPATLTYVANAASREYGEPNPLFSGAVSGFVGGETLVTATTGTLSFTSPATQSSVVGQYAINGGGLSANFGNYAFAQAAANATALTISGSASVVSPVAPPSQVETVVNQTIQATNAVVGNVIAQLQPPAGETSRDEPVAPSSSGQQSGDPVSPAARSSSKPAVCR